MIQAKRLQTFAENMESLFLVSILGRENTVVWRSAIKETQSYTRRKHPYIERLNRTFREDVLDAYLFESLTEVKALAFEWQMDYNQNHPHKALNGKSPWIYKNEIMNLTIN